MKKRLFKNLFFVMVMAVLCMAVAVTASAEYSGTCGADGDNVTWRIDTDTGTLIIEGKGDMGDYDRTPWQYNDLINNVEVRSGVTSIGENALLGIENIKIGPDVSKLSSTSFDYGISNIEIDPDNNYFVYEDYAIYSKDKKTLYVAFSKMKDNYERIFIPEGVETLAKGSLAKAYTNSNGTEFYIPSTVENLTVESFLIPSFVSDYPEMGYSYFYIHENNKHFEADGKAIYNKDKTILILGNSITDIPNTVEEIGDYAFYGHYLEGVIIPDSVKTIGSYNIATESAASYGKIFIPKTVTTFKEETIFFPMVMGDIPLIYYEGTEEQWNNLYPYETYINIIFNHTHSFTTEQLDCNYYNKCSGCDLKIFDHDEHGWWYDYTRDGAAYYTCDRCFEGKVEPTEANEHVWRIAHGVTSNCEEGGTLPFYCELSCGKYKTETFEPTEHNWEYDVMESWQGNCEEGARLCYYCTVCDSDKVELIEPKEHNWELTGKLIDNCEEGGIEYYTCNTCSSDKTEEAAPKAHTIAWSSNNDATCTKDGTKTSYCTECNVRAIETVTDIGTALGHDYNEEWTVLTEATCSQNGVSVRGCNRCGSIDADIEKAYGHYDDNNDNKCDDCLCLIKESDTNKPDEPTEPDEPAEPDEPSEPDDPPTDDPPEETSKNPFTGFLDIITNFIQQIKDFFNNIFNF